METNWKALIAFYKMCVVEKQPDPVQGTADAFSVSVETVVACINGAIASIPGGNIANWKEGGQA